MVLNYADKLNYIKMKSESAYTTEEAYEVLDKGLYTELSFKFNTFLAVVILNTIHRTFPKARLTEYTKRVGYVHHGGQLMVTYPGAYGGKINYYKFNNIPIKLDLEKAEGFISYYTQEVLSRLTKDFDFWYQQNIHDDLGNLVYFYSLYVADRQGCTSGYILRDKIENLIREITRVISQYSSEHAMMVVEDIKMRYGRYFKQAYLFRGGYVHEKKLTVSDEGWLMYIKLKDKESFILEDAVRVVKANRYEEVC